MSGTALDRFTSDARELVRLLAGTDVAELDLAIGDFRLSIKRGEATAITAANGLPVSLVPPDGGEVVEDRTSEPGLVIVNSPVVGWFRRAGGVPGGPPLVEEGQAITAGQVLGIIEAVQVVHEVTSDRAGVVEAFLVSDGMGVEYGQPLVRLREPS